MRRVWFAAFVLSTATGPASAQPSGYTVTLLSRDPANFQLVQATALDDEGVAVGSGIRDLDGGGAFACVRWAPDGTLEDLGGSVHLAYSECNDVNERGTIAATAAHNPNVNRGKAHTIDTSRPSPVDRLEPFDPSPGLLNSALGINDLGAVVGMAETGNESPFDADNPFAVATLWNEDGGLTVLGARGDVAWAIDVNDAGRVIGRSSTPASTFAGGFVWDAEGGMRPLNGFDGAPDLGAVAVKINEAGTFVGWSSPDPFGPEATAAVWFSEAQATPLPSPVGAFRSEALGINDRGEIVGRALFEGDDTEAVIWTDGGVFSLNELVGDPRFDIFSALDINDRGQILVGLFDASGPELVFYSAVLTPIAAE